MLLNREIAVTVFRKVKYIREEYRTYILNGDATRISIEDLQKVISQMYQLEIKKTQVSFEGVYVRGMMERHTHNKILIRVKQDQSDDYKRFTVVKEMMHPVIDEEEDWSSNGVDTISDLLNEHLLENTEEARRVVQSEMFAEIAAIELLYPFEFRIGDMKRIADKESTIVKIASHHGLPVKMVSTALSMSYHHELAVPLWDEVNALPNVAE